MCKNVLIRICMLQTLFGTGTPEHMGMEAGPCHLFKTMYFSLPWELENGCLKSRLLKADMFVFRVPCKEA